MFYSGLSYVPLSLEQVIIAWKKREYEWGRGKAGTFWEKFYQTLDHPTKSVFEVIVQGRAEMFLSLPEGIEWFGGVLNLHSSPAAGEEEFETHVINSAGWNAFISEGSDTTIQAVHDLVFKNNAAPALKQKIENMLEYPESTFAADKAATMICTFSDKRMTVLEGNATVLAFYHKSLSTPSQRTTAIFLPVIIGMMRDGASYPFLRFHNGEKATLNTIWMKSNKTQQDVAQYIFPEHVKATVKRLKSRMF